MPASNWEALSQLASAVLAPLLLVFAVVSLYLIWALAEAAQLAPALLVLAAAVIGLFVAVKLHQISVGATQAALTAGEGAPGQAHPAPGHPPTMPPPAAPPLPAPTSPAAEPPERPPIGRLPFRLGLPHPDALQAPRPTSTLSTEAPPPDRALPVRLRALSRVTWFRAALVVLAITTALAFRLVALDDLPGELFGDIATIWESVDAVLKGKWPTTFEQSNGPLYGYTIAPIIAVLGQQGFLSYKLASVIISLVTIVLTFLIAREIAGTDLALLASIILSVSSWHVVFSRLGNSQVLAPTIVAASLLLLVLGIKRQDFRLVLAGAVVSTLSYYGYAPLLILPGAYVLTAAFYLRRDQLAVLVAVAGLLTIPFLIVILRQQDVFLAGSGYIGGKLLSVENWQEKLVGNILRSALMFHGQGDGISRANPAGLPQLDVLSGLFLLCGGVYWLLRPQRHWLPFLLVPFLVLQVPANLVLNEALPTPSASRSIGILPILAVVIAGGIWLVATRIRDARVARPAFVLAVIAVICWLNWQRYFVAYANGLPEQNSPYAKLMAGHFDTLPADATVVMYNCCWGQAGQPEPKGIQYVIKRLRVIQVIPPGQFSCQALNLPSPVEFVWSPGEDPPIPPSSCFPGLPIKVYSDSRGQPVFQEIYIDRPSATGAATPR